MKLYDRAYVVTIGVLQTSNLRCVFSVKKDLKGKPNTVDLKIYNLSATNRKLIEAFPETTIQIDAGYADGTSTIFIGDVRTKVTEREGANLITHVAAGDGEKAIQKSRVNMSFAKGSTTAQVLQALAASLGVDPGNISQAVAKLAPFGSMFSLGTVLSGSSQREMTRILRSVGFTWSIQNGKLQILAIKEVLAGSAILLSSATGLTGSPTVDKDGMVNCKSLMIPDVFPGRLMVLEGENVKGQFRIQETTHAGDSYGGDWGIDIKAKRY